MSKKEDELDYVLVIGAFREGYRWDEYTSMHTFWTSPTKSLADWVQEVGEKERASKFKDATEDNFRADGRWLLWVLRYCAVSKVDLPDWAAQASSRALMAAKWGPSRPTRPRQASANY